MRGKTLQVALILLLALAFTIANRAAYKGYFQDDSLDNLVMTRDLDLKEFATALLVPKFYSNNFRPVGHLYFKLMGRSAGLHFPAYIASLHLLHIVNVCLLYLLLRKLGLPLIAACAGAFFFAFDMAAFSAFWDPMYVFDLLCGLFCLATLLLYIDGYWIWSLLTFWLAYRAKEVAIMLPLVLLAYEASFAGRRWPRLLPFFAVSLALGAQALAQNRGTKTDYTLHFDPASIWTCIQFYAGKIFLVPFAGFALLAGAALVRDRRYWFGVCAFCVLLLPMLFLPGRLFSTYLYVPLIGAAMCIASIAMLQPKAAIAALVVLWLPWNYVNMRWDRRTALAQADQNRAYVTGMRAVSREHPGITSFLYDGAPFHTWGVSAALRWFHPNQQLVLAAVDDPAADRLLSNGAVVVLNWHGKLQALVHTQSTPDAAYIRMGDAVPIWQLQGGWYSGEGTYRWIQPTAAARLARPPGAKCFELKVNIGPALIAAVHQTRVRVLLDGNTVGERVFNHAGWQTVRFPLPPAPPGTARVRLEVDPGFRPPSDTRLLGVAVVAFGFVT